MAARQDLLEGNVSPVTEGLTPADVGDAWFASLPMGSELEPYALHSGTTPITPSQPREDENVEVVGQSAPVGAGRRATRLTAVRCCWWVRNT